MTPLTAHIARRAKTINMGRMPRKKEVVLHGKVFTLYSIGWLAIMASKHVNTLRQYESRKIMPEPLLKTKSHKRWYLPEEISGYAAIIKSFHLRPNVPLENTGLQTALYNYRSKLKMKMAHNLVALQQELKGEKAMYNFVTGMKAHSIHAVAKTIFPKV